MHGHLNVKIRWCAENCDHGEAAALYRAHSIVIYRFPVFIVHYATSQLKNSLFLVRKFICLGQAVKHCLHCDVLVYGACFVYLQHTE